MAEGNEIPLGGAFEGHHVIVKPRALTLGLLEDLQSEKVGLVLDAFARVLAGGDIPMGTTRKGLREITPDELKSLMQAVRDASELPKQR